MQYRYLELITIITGTKISYYMLQLISKYGIQKYLSIDVTTILSQLIVLHDYVEL